MRKKLTIITIFLIIILMLGICFSNVSNAAIESKNGTSAHTGITVSQAYQYCYDMRSSTSTLGNNSLDPHLTLNKDWGAIAYLGASVYGNTRSNVGESVTIGDRAYNSTTNNITGVMNMHSTDRYFSSFTSSLYLEKISSYTKKLEENIGSKYVETLSYPFSIETTKGQALTETAGWWGGTANFTGGFGVVHRGGITGFSQGDGNQNATIRYRAAIWN